MAVITDLPGELLLTIGCHLNGYLPCLNALAQVSRRLHAILGGLLYKFDAERRASVAVTWAVRHSNPGTLRKALQAGSSPEPPFGGKPIHVASANGFDEGVDLLLRYGADVNKTQLLIGSVPVYRKPTMHSPMTNVSALFLAARCAHESTVRLLLSRGASPTVIEGTKENILHWCAESGLVDIMQELLDSDAYDVSQADDNGKTPLHHAVMFEEGRWAVSWLLANGANIEATDNDGNTPLMLACETGSFATALDLLDANVSPQSASPGTLLHMCAEKKLFIVDAGTSLPIGTQGPMTRFEQLQWDLVRRLLAAGIDIEDVDGKQTALTKAAGEGAIETVACLLRAGADPNNKTPKESVFEGLGPTSDNYGFTPLQNAIYYRIGATRNNTTEYTRREKAALLLDNGAELDITDNLGQTPLYSACLNEDYGMAQLLLERGANICLVPEANRVTREREQSVLSQVTQYGSIPLAKLLIEYGAKFNPATDDTNTSIFTAIREGERSFISQLINQAMDERHRNSITDETWGDFLTEAILNGRDHIAVWFLQNHARQPSQDDVRAVVAKNCLRTMRYLLSDEASGIRPHWNLEDVFREAILRGQTEIAKLIFDHGVEIQWPERWRAQNAQDLPLCKAIQQNAHEIFERIIDEHPNILDYVDLDGDTCLHLAAKSGSYDIINVLLDRGLAIDPQNGEGKSPAMLLVEHVLISSPMGSIMTRNALETLGRRGARGDLRDVNGDSAVDYLKSLVKMRTGITGCRESTDRWWDLKTWQPEGLEKIMDASFH